jgi:hypothetical protein
MVRWRMISRSERYMWRAMAFRAASPDSTDYGRDSALWCFFLFFFSMCTTIVTVRPQLANECLDLLSIMALALAIYTWLANLNNFTRSSRD